MIEITSRGTGFGNKYQNIKIKVSDTTISLDTLDSEEILDICGNLEEFLLDMDYKTVREKELEKALSEIYELAHDKFEGPDLPDTLWEIREMIGDVL